ncbi:tetratricopeptide repeat protein [Thermogemmata fonticola]|uniref:Tetratricopeptide repeat protein n=1 Tax=Thermogemmata fonticola TaxID=2755323 RepID=A0A7V8VGZ7_9BACT|nr:tetratricopeptide repeat protein [Thermogemmata fonticola]MBA2227880.1 tetratricopeptide repeat protein [Thermogemmata fonticola]
MSSDSGLPAEPARTPAPDEPEGSRAAPDASASACSPSPLQEIGASIPAAIPNVGKTGEAPSPVCPGTGAIPRRCGPRFQSWQRVIVTGLLLAGLGVGGWAVWDEWRFRATLSRARLEAERGHTQAAIRALEWCIQRRPEQREVILLSAQIARRSGHLESAENLLDQYWQLYGDEEPLVLERLLLQAARGDVDAVAARLRERMQRNTAERRLIQEAWISGLLARFRWGEAGQFLTQWLADSPEDPWALYLFGRLQEQRDDVEGAKEYYRRLVESDPEHDEARQRLAQLLVQTRHGEEAEPHVRFLLTRLNPPPREVQVLWARTLVLLGRLDEAQAALDAVLSEHPHYPAALAERGKVALFQEQPGEALRYLAEAVHYDPGDLAIRHQYAMVLSQQGREEEAAQQRKLIAQLEADGERIKALIEGPLQREPNNAAIHHEIGMIALRAGQITEALRWFHSALRIDPQHAPTHRVLMVYYEESGQPALAARHRALARDTDRQKTEDSSKIQPPP